MSIKKNLDILQKFIRLQSTEVKILAVSKYHSKEEILIAYLAGQRLFGESKVQEAIQKIESTELAPLEKIEWHFIGQIQKNKLNKICQYFDTIQSVDSFEKLQKISNFAQKLNKTIHIFLQININSEERYGFKQQDLLQSSPQSKDYPNIIISGIMVMLPNIKDSNKIIQKCKEIQSFYSSLKEKIQTLETLSMGMSQDYKVAVKNGSNMIRIGSGIFKE